MKANTKAFGRTQNGQEALLYEISNTEGMQVKITNLGATITSIKTPDRDGNSEEIVAGFSQLKPYLQNNFYFGSTIGRYANRIDRGALPVNETLFQLPINNCYNHLHGGSNGFHAQLWDGKLEVKSHSATLSLTLHSPHLQEGYPGNIKAMVQYTLHSHNQLDITYEVITDRPTHINLTNHTYFNLSSFKEKIHSHDLYISANQLLDTNSQGIPTGKMRSTKGTPFDFSHNQKLSKLRVEKFELDHCYVFNQPYNNNSPQIILTHKTSGRRMKVSSTQPGVQIYTANKLDGSITGHNGIQYQKHHAICLETQHFPDTPNQPAFPSTLISPNKNYRQQIQWIFDVCPSH